MLTSRFPTGSVFISRFKHNLLPFARYGLIVLDGLIVCIPFLFLVFQIFFHCIDTGMNPVRETISMYVYCGYGYMQTISLHAIAALMIGVTVRLYFVLPSSSLSRAGISLIGLTSLGMLLVAIFPTRAHDAVLTWKNVLHVVTALGVSGLFPLSLLLLSPAFRQYPHFKNIYSVSVISACIAILVGIAGTVIIGGGLTGLGIVERILMLNAIIWLMVLGVNLLKYDIAKTSN
jgi:hypothetical protein